MTLPACEVVLGKTVTLPLCTVQNPFTQERSVQGLPATLFGLPVAAVYVLGAALAAALGFGGWTLASRLLPGAWRQEGPCSP